MTLKRQELADLPAEAALSQRQVLARAYRDYHRYSVTLKHGDVSLVQERDVLIAGKVAVVIPIANFDWPRISPTAAANSSSSWPGASNRASHGSMLRGENAKKKSA